MIGIGVEEPMPWVLMKERSSRIVDIRLGLGFNILNFNIIFILNRLSRVYILILFVCLQKDSTLLKNPSCVDRMCGSLSSFICFSVREISSLS